jgi:acyl-CoA reductase-like NAD-dependent aldehyde dehydrogenase
LRLLTVVQGITKILQGLYASRDVNPVRNLDEVEDILRRWPEAIKRTSDDLARLAAELEAMKAEAINEQTPVE